MATATTAPAAPPSNFQGVLVNPQSINPQLFMLSTRRTRGEEYGRNWAGFGATDRTSLLKSDILSRVFVRFSGSLVVAPSTGSVASTAAWPYNLASNVKLSANRQSQLIDCAGLSLKLREIMVGPTSDRGVSQQVGAATVTQGTLSSASESWGVGSAHSAIADGTYPVELVWVLPVAEDDRDLTGALFCQAASTDITVSIAWANLADLFTVVAPATVTLTGTVSIETEKFSIPDPGGSLILPDLSLFHSVIDTDYTSLANGNNIVTLIGQGAGKQLLRVWARTLNGSPASPVSVNATNYGPLGWMYGTHEQPEQYVTGQALREENEADYNSDIGAVWGYFCHDFALRNAFRDTLDEGQMSELRLAVTLQSGLALSSPALIYTQESMFGA